MILDTATLICNDFVGFMALDRVGRRAQGTFSP
jgi:hypothetical protein